MRFGSSAWFSGIFQAMADAAPFLDLLSMAGLLSIGVSMVHDAGVKLHARRQGAGVPDVPGDLPARPGRRRGRPDNPITTTHWLGVAMLITVAATRAGDTLGLGRR